MEDTLSVGDIVCLYSEESSGFVFAKQSSSVHNQLAVGARQDRVRPHISDQHVVAFEVCVANRYKLNKKYAKLKGQSEEDPSNIKLKNSAAQAKIAALAENEDNDLEQKRNQGKKVVYGQVVQLRHVFTGKYVHVSTTKTSAMESNNMAVELHADNAKHAQFRIMPRYKVKAEGDVVQVDDQIVLESIKSSGQYLHVSRQHLPSFSIYSQNFELNLSVRQSGFTVYRKYKPTPEDENKVKVGDLIRFYHKEMEAYLVAEGLFDDELTEDVHLRMRPVDQNNPKTMFPSSSAVTYWQIELQDGPIAGGILKWEQQCRIIHCCTRKYLTIDANGKVTLTSNYLDPRTVFRLHAVIRDSDDIHCESYSRIEHVVSGSWLHALADEYKKKEDTDGARGDDNSMSGLKYSTAQLRKKKKERGDIVNIGSIHEKQYDDAFTVQMVDPPLVEIFNYMAGMVPFIQKLVADKKDGVVLNAKMAHDVITALKEMEDFMIVNSVPSKNRQKLMRNLRIVELLVSLLGVPCRGAPDTMHLTKIFLEAYDVLYTYLMGNSRKNELYIAKYIDFFLTQFEYKEGGIGLNAAHMVMELIRDNRKIVDRISHANINTFVDFLHREKNYRYLELLSVLCVCDGVSIADNQKNITEVWLMRGNKMETIKMRQEQQREVRRSNCVYRTDLGEVIGKKPGVIYVSVNNGKTWQELQDFAKNTATESDEYLFLERQLELFGMLCHGQNEFAINVITKELNYLTWEEAYTCLSDVNLPDRLRAKYCDLIITMFVDIGDNVSVVDRVKLSYIYDQIDSAEGEKATEDLLDRSNSPTYKYFPQLSEWISQFLANNGDMTASEIGNNMLVQQVLRLVHFLVKYGFYHKSADIRMLLKPLMSLVDGRNDKPFPDKFQGAEAEEVVKYFQKTGRFQKSEETQAIVDAKLQALEVLSLFFNFIFNLRMEKFMNIFKITHGQAATQNMPPPELFSLLNDNEDFDIEDNSSLCRTALRRLDDIFTETDLFEKKEITEILMDLSDYDYDDMVRKSMYLLNRYYSSHNTLFSRAVQAQVLTTDDSVKVANKLDLLLPKLRRLATSKLNSDQVTELCDIIDQLKEMCHLDGEPEEHHAMNQNILYNFGVLEDCFTILSQDIDVKLLDQYGGLRKIFQKTFLLLKNMARNNKQVQTRLFDRVDMLLTKEGAPAELAEALTEVFTGNSNTCMKIMNHQVQKIMGLVAQHKTEVPQFLDLLNAVVKVEELDLPLKRNQGFVMTYFMQFRAEVADIIDDNEQKKNRVQVLEGSSTKDLNYLIALVDLLATCAEGENRYIESICQTIFSISDIVEVLNNKKINNNFQRPYLRFFLWVYLNTAGGMIESGAGDLPHDKTIWDFMDGLDTDLQNMKKYAEEKPDKVKILLKQPPTKLGDLSPADEEMKGTFHYFFDAVMPFFQIFCRSYYQPDELFPDEATKLATLTKSYEAFMDTVAPCVSIERQLKSLVGAMTALITASNAIPMNKIEEFRSNYGKGNQDIRSDGRKKYEWYYSEEEEINIKLNVFAVNMEKAYGGKNDVRTQLGLDDDREYSEVGGDEELPLGEEFQDHLKCFVDDKVQKPLIKYKRSEKLIKQLSISQSLTILSEKERMEQQELDLKCLMLLRGLIHNEILKLPEDWEGESKGNKKALKRIQEVQDALNHYDVVESTLAHLSRPQDDIVRELLAFLAALLYSGNSKVQDSMYAYFTGTREETFFFAVKSRVQLSALATRERRLLHAMHQAKIEDMVAQAKALQKVMKSGAVSALDAMQANQLGSMLSMVKQSRLSLQKSKKNLRLSRTSLGKRKMGSSLAIKPALGSQALMSGDKLASAINGGNLMVPGVGAKPRPGTALSNKKKKQVSPEASITPEVDVKIEEIDEEELKELTENAVAMSDDLDFKDDGYIELVLRVLGLMCDNQKKGLQDYLREQPDNIKSVNLVAETTKFLQILYSSVNNKTIPLITQLFDTLVEFTSGNFQNQAIVFDNKICEYINHMLRAGQFKGCDEEEIYTLKNSIAALIRSLSEENPPLGEEEVTLGSQPLSQEVLEYLDSETLVGVMTEAYRTVMINQLYTEGQDSVDEQGKSQRDPLYDTIADVGFVYYHILCRKMDLHPHIIKQQLAKTPEDDAAWEFFKANTLSIEIVKDDVLQKIYFQVKDKNVLREEIKEKFKYEVDRSSPSNKLRDFMDWSSCIIDDIKYQRKIHANPLARFFVQSWWWLNPAVLMLTFALSILILVSWEAPTDSSDPVPVMSKYEGAQVMTYILGGIHNLLSLFIFISYFLSNHPTFPKVKNIKKVLASYIPSLQNEDSEDEEEYTKVAHLEVKFFSVTTFYYITFLLCSILGTVFYGYFFSFHLLHMALMNQLLKRVIQALTRNGVSLILVAILGLAITFMFSLVTFAFYRDLMDANQGRQCRTSYECFTTLIHHGIVEGMYTTFEQKLEDQSYKRTLYIALFDVIFFVLITTIGLNIIFGIIVDTFSELRDSKVRKSLQATIFWENIVVYKTPSQQPYGNPTRRIGVKFVQRNDIVPTLTPWLRHRTDWQIDNDMKTTCFICSRESYDFERQAGGFEKHVRQEHNQWAYLFFFIHLDETRPNDYSALELFVRKLLKKNNFDFFPLNRALSLMHEEDSSEQKLETLMQQVQYMVTKIKEEEATKERDKEKQRQAEWEAKHKQKGSPKE